MELKFEDIIREKAPALTVALIEADIKNTETDDELWNQIETVAGRIKDSYEMEMVNKVVGLLNIF